MTSNASRIGQRRMYRTCIFLAREFISVGSGQHVGLRAVMRAPTIAGNITGADFILGHTPGAVTIRAEVAFLLVENHRISQRHFCRRAQREVAVIVGRVASEAADLRGIRDKFLDIDLAGPSLLNKTFVGMATLAVIGVGITRVTERSVTRSLVLTAHAAHRIFTLGTVTSDAIFGQNTSLRIGN